MSDISPEVHGGVTDEQIEDFFARNPDFSPLTPVTPPTSEAVPNEPELDPDDAPVVEPEVDPNAPEVDPNAPEPPSEPDPELDQLRALQTAIQSDPALRAKIAEHLASPGPPAGTAVPNVPEAVPEAPQIDESALDLDDPAIAALYNMVKQQGQQLGQVQSAFQQQQQVQLAQMRATAESTYKRAAYSFAQNHNLTADEVDDLSTIASRLGVLPSLMQGIDPTTGLPTRPDPLSAMDRALEIALYSTEKYRKKANIDAQATQRRHSQRRQKLQAVSGNSGSVARQQPAPQGQAETRQAMVNEVAAMFNGSWTGDN